MEMRLLVYSWRVELDVLAPSVSAMLLSSQPAGLWDMMSKRGERGEREGG